MVCSILIKILTHDSILLGCDAVFSCT